MVLEPFVNLLLAYAIVIQMKKLKKNNRNAFAIAAKKKKAGRMKDKTETRKNGKNKQLDILKESNNDN